MVADALVTETAEAVEPADLWIAVVPIIRAQAHWKTPSRCQVVVHVRNIAVVFSAASLRRKRETLFWFCAAIVHQLLSSKPYVSIGAHHVIAELGAGGAAGIAARDGERLFREHAFVQRAAVSLSAWAWYPMWDSSITLARKYCRNGFSVLGASLLHHARRRAVNGPKHYAALKLMLPLPAVPTPPWNSAALSVR